MKSQSAVPFSCCGTTSTATDIGMSKVPVLCPVPPDDPNIRQEDPETSCAKRLHRVGAAIPMTMCNPSKSSDECGKELELRHEHMSCKIHGGMRVCVAF